jgi:hypothetical protein
LKGGKIWRAIYKEKRNHLVTRRIYFLVEVGIGNIFGTRHIYAAHGAGYGEANTGRIGNKLYMGGRGNRPIAPIHNVKPPSPSP